MYDSTQESNYNLFNKENHVYIQINKTDIPFLNRWKILEFHFLSRKKLPAMVPTFLEVFYPKTLYSYSVA